MKKYIITFMFAIMAIVGFSQDRILIGVSHYFNGNICDRADFYTTERHCGECAWGGYYHYHYYDYIHHPASYYGQRYHNTVVVYRSVPVHHHHHHHYNHHQPPRHGSVHHHPSSSSSRPTATPSNRKPTGSSHGQSTRPQSSRSTVSTRK